MAESSESDHFSDIFGEENRENHKSFHIFDPRLILPALSLIPDSTSDLTLVIGHLDRQLRISEEGQDDEANKEDHQQKSRAQPQSTSSIAIDTQQQSSSSTGHLHLEINKDVLFPNRSLSSSASSLIDDDQGGGGGGGPSGGGVKVTDGRGACVLERAAMEIIESEGSYVVDLRQVIEGYLHDWKERACLKLDELDTLFGNLEQLYVVNAQLNERLKATQGDVELIAKCFLDLRDEFIVYTTYW